MSSYRRTTQYDFCFTLWQNYFNRSLRTGNNRWNSWNCATKECCSWSNFPLLRPPVSYFSTHFISFKKTDWACFICICVRVWTFCLGSCWILPLVSAACVLIAVFPLLYNPLTQPSPAQQCLLHVHGTFASISQTQVICKAHRSQGLALYQVNLEAVNKTQISGVLDMILMTRLYHHHACSSQITSASFNCPMQHK